MRFKDGQQLTALHLHEASFKVGENYSYGVVESITVVMQNGQMAEVAWAKVYFKSGAIQMWNLALVEGIEFAGKSEFENTNRE